MITGPPPHGDATVNLVGLPKGRGRLALVTGASGYIGGRLVTELLNAGWQVRVLARHPEMLRDRPWFEHVQVIRGDVGDEQICTRALTDVWVAYYLIHSMGSVPRFAHVDRAHARVFAKCSREQGVKRIVYLGGLYPKDEQLSDHLESRAEVGEIFLACGVPVANLQAAVILGSGSASFEMLRYLTERLPVMVVPRWVGTRIQPIAIRDVLRYLVGAATLPASVSRSFDIGGPDILTYRDMMQRYAKVAGLPRRLIMPLGVVQPGISSHWVALITPVPRALARPLMESLIHEVVCKEDEIRRYVPDPPEGLIGFERAVELALARVHEASVATRWASALPSGAPSDSMPSDPEWAGGSLYVDERTTTVPATPESLWSVIEGIGGVHGWYSWSLAWTVRGVLDRFSGGPGLRRGRRDPNALVVGDTVDWWRVEEIQRPQVLRLRAEMRLPGKAWLDLRVKTNSDGETVFYQRAYFYPHGLLGQLYWWSVWPFHGIVFGGMQRNIAKAAVLAQKRDMQS